MSWQRHEKVMKRMKKSCVSPLSGLTKDRRMCAEQLKRDCEAMPLSELGQ